MNKKKFYSQIKRGFTEFANNGCVMCIHNQNCTSPLNGKVSMSNPCPHAEHIPDEEIMLLALKNVFGLSPEKCAQFKKKMKEKLHD